MRTFTAKFPKDWAAAAEKELKGAPLEELTWHTAEVRKSERYWIIRVLGNKFETYLHARRH